MPGLVLSIMVQPGDSVVKGDGLMVLEGNENGKYY